MNNLCHFLGETSVYDKVSTANEFNLDVDIENNKTDIRMDQMIKLILIKY